MPAHKQLQEDVDADLPPDNGASHQEEEEKQMKEDEEEEEEDDDEEEEEEEHHLENEGEFIFDSVRVAFRKPYPPDSDRSPSSSSATEKEDSPELASLKRWLLTNGEISEYYFLIILNFIFREAFLNHQYERYVRVKLSDVRKEVQCPICLGIIRKTRTVMECLHRFCRECIDKSMRMGNKECPACRTHCASRRSLRDDPNYDALIAALYPDIDHYEEEELAFHDEDDARNKQIQASIAETLKRQSEALTKKRKRSQSISRRRASYQSDDDDDDDDGDDDENDNSSSGPENRRKRSRRWKGRGSLEPNREATPVAGLAWGRGGIRSSTRHGTAAAAASNTSKHSRTNRLAVLAHHLRNLDHNHEMDIHIILVSLDLQSSPRLQQPYICCRPTLSVRQLCQFIAFQTTLQVDQVEILALKHLNPKLTSSLLSLDAQPLLGASKDELQLLDLEDTLQGIKATFSLLQGHLILAYRPKSLGQEARDNAVGGN